MMGLTAENVENVARDCMRGEEEVDDDVITVDGIVSKFVFNKVKVTGHEQDIIDMLDQLPDGFKQSKGGGWSFLMACDDRNGEQWGEQVHMEALFCLGRAIGKVSWMPREIWSALPGGVPYVTVDL